MVNAAFDAFDHPTRTMPVVPVPRLPDELGPGSVIAGRYRLKAEIARGGMATVYRGHDERLGRDVAVKVCNPCPDILVPALREERVSSGLIHNNVVSIFDGGDIPPGEPGAGSSFIVMEFVHGTTAHAVAPVPWKHAVDIVRQAAEGLAAAHERGIVHCDVKPGNLLLDRNGRVLVADFGVATESNGEVGDYVYGSPAYLAPERLHGDPPNPRVDVFGLGSVLAYLLTGEKPAPGEQPSLPRACPASVARVISRSRAQDPRARYPDARAFAAALDEAVTDATGGQDVVVSTTEPTRSIPVERRRPVTLDPNVPTVDRRRSRPVSISRPQPVKKNPLELAPADGSTVPPIQCFPVPVPRTRRTRRLSRSALALIAAGALALVLLLAGGRLLGAIVSDGEGGSNAAPVAAAGAMPDVRGQTFADAIDTLAAEGIAVDRVEIIYGPGTLNLVVDQLPAPGDDSDDDVILVVRTSK